MTDVLNHKAGGAGGASGANMMIVGAKQSSVGNGQQPGIRKNAAYF
jgi:hypothetical protein